MGSRVRVVPAFVVVGVESEDGCALYASRTLTRADLEAKIDLEAEPGWDVGTPLRYRPAGRWFEMHASMRDVAVAHGPTFGEALANLVRYWDPESGPVPIDQGEFEEGLRERMRELGR